MAYDGAKARFNSSQALSTDAFSMKAQTVSRLSETKIKATSLASACEILLESL